MTMPGDARVLASLRGVAEVCGLALDVRDDRHFFAAVPEFAAHAVGRKQLRMEFFYREMRRRHAVLMDGDEPVGGQWNFDADNRESFGKSGPGVVPRTRALRTRCDHARGDRRSCGSASPRIPDRSTASPGPSRANRRGTRCSVSSTSGSSISAVGKTRCGRVSPSCVIRACRRR